jgi:AcrR family transcriptional regulator
MSLRVINGGFMGRWEADAEGRLRTAALELFAELGYEQTSVAAIAERAGVTARTFFRYFADKREVLFNGSQHLQEAMVAGIANAPAKANALEAVAAALIGASDFFDEGRRGFARQRHAVVAANAELFERELIKLSTLAKALADALRARGVDAGDAMLLAESGIAIFHVVFRRWVARGEKRGFHELMGETLQRWQALASLRLSPAPRPARPRASAPGSA